jgi:hypothetical protein
MINWRLFGHRLSRWHVVRVHYFSFFIKPHFFTNMDMYELGSISAEVEEGIEKI